MIKDTMYNRPVDDPEESSGSNSGSSTDPSNPSGGGQVDDPSEGN